MHESLHSNIKLMSQEEEEEPEEPNMTDEPNVSDDGEMKQINFINLEERQNVRLGNGNQSLHFQPH